MSSPTLPLVIEAFLPGFNATSGNQAAVHLGDRSYSVTKLPKGSQFSFFIFDRADPMKGPVFTTGTAGTDTTTVPPGLAKYTNDKYLMIVVTQNATLHQVPQGPLYQFLNDHGAFKQLKRWEIIASTKYACGVTAGLVYAMVSIPGKGATGFEMFELQSTSARITGKSYVATLKTAPFILTAQLVPVDIAGTVRYTVEEM